MSDKRVAFSEGSFELVRQCLRTGDRLQALELFEKTLLAFKLKGGQLADEALALQAMASSLLENGHGLDARRFSNRVRVAVNLIVSDHLSRLDEPVLQKKRRLRLRIVR
jgi:hypothetical protein